MAAVLFRATFPETVALTEGRIKEAHSLIAPPAAIDGVPETSEPDGLRRRSSKRGESEKSAVDQAAKLGMVLSTSADEPSGDAKGKESGKDGEDTGGSDGTSSSPGLTASGGDGEAKKDDDAVVDGGDTAGAAVSESESSSEMTDDCPALVVSLSDEISRILAKNGNPVAFWSKCDHNPGLCQVSFTVRRGPIVDIILRELVGLGIGSEFGQINVLPVEIMRKAATAKKTKEELEKAKAEKAERKAEEEKEKAALALEAGDDVGDGTTTVPDDEETTDETYGELSDEESDYVAGAMIVESVVESTMQAARTTPDYVILVTVASLLAGIGLATNSVVVIVASMLVSPLMGPILALTFASIVHDWKVVRLGVKSELLGLLISVLCGVVVGIVGAPFGPDPLEWPNPEMADRGTYAALGVGIAVALVSGVGVALSVLGNNTNSLVGVAISASLLPPAVNCGINLSYALVGWLIHGPLPPNDVSVSLSYGPYGNATDVDLNMSVTPVDANDLHGVDSMYHLEIAFMSLSLTLLNILFIIISAWIMFKIKEVGPFAKSQFWEHHVPNARTHHTVMTGDKAEKYRARILKYQKQNGLREEEDRPVFGPLPYAAPAAPSRWSNLSVADIMAARGPKASVTSIFGEHVAHPAPPALEAAAMTPPPSLRRGSLFGSRVNSSSGSPRSPSRSPTFAAQPVARSGRVGRAPATLTPSHASSARGRRRMSNSPRPRTAEGGRSRKPPRGARPGPEDVVSARL